MVDTESHKHRLDWLLAIFCCVIWGYCTPLAKVCYSWLQIDSSDIWSLILFCGTRFAIAGFAIILYKAFQDKKMLLPKKEFRKGIIIVAGLSTVLCNALFFIGLASALSTRTTVMCAMPSFFVLIICIFIIRTERFNGLRILGCILGIAGVIYMNVSGTSQAQPISFRGEGMVFLAVVLDAICSVLTREYTQKADPLEFSGWQMFLGGVFMIVAGFAMGGRFHMDAWWRFSSMVLMGLSASVAFGIWTVLLSRNEASYVVNYKLFEPITGVLISAFLLGELSLIDPVKCTVALALVCFGMYLTGHTPKRAAGQ